MTTNQKLDFRFHSDNGVFHREYEIQDNSEIHQFVNKFLDLIEREDLFDANRATQSLIEKGEFQDGALILYVKAN